MVLASNEQRLLDAVYRDPRAEDARRVYADWLVGHGDPRGEFIHLQLDRSQGRATTDQFARERALLQSHCDTWILPFHATDHVVFERGFVTRVALAPERMVQTRVVVPEPPWSTIEELFVDPPEPFAPEAFVPLADAPYMAGLRRVAAPLAVLEAMTESVRRQWRGMTLLDWSWPTDSLVGLSGRLPRLDTVGLCVRHSSHVPALCARPPLLPQVRRLEVLWSDDGLSGCPLANYIELVERSTLDVFRWFDTSQHGELVLRRTGQHRLGRVEGDAHMLEESRTTLVTTVTDEIRVYWDEEMDDDDYEGVCTLAEQTGATLEFETIPRARVLPTLEMEWTL